MSVLLFSGLVGPVNRFPGWEAVQWWYISKAAGELEALHMEVPKVRKGFLSLETSRWHVLLDELGVCKPDCWSPSGSVCCLALGLCECPGQSEVEVPHLWPLLHPCADSMPGSKSTSKGHKLASVWWTSWWSQLCFCWETGQCSALARGLAGCMGVAVALSERRQRQGVCPALQDLQLPSVHFPFSFSSAYQIIYLLLTMPVFNYSLHDLAWNQVLVTDQPGLVWSLSTVWCHPSAFNTGSWPRWVWLPFSCFCISLG